MKKLATQLRNLIFPALFVAGMIAISVSLLFAAEEKPTGDLTVSALSRYILRGYEMSRNSVVIQPSLTIDYKGFTANLMGNMDTNPYSPAGESYAGTFDETDATLSYSKTMGLFTIGGGYALYSLNAVHKDAEVRNNMNELFASLGLTTLLAPTLTVYRDINHYRNWYFQIGISHIAELSKNISLKLAASAGYLLSTDADTYPKYDDDALVTADKFRNFHDGLVSASLPVQVTDRITVTPNIAYTFPLTSDAKAEMQATGLKGTSAPADRETSFVYGGISLGCSF